MGGGEPESVWRGQESHLGINLHRSELGKSEVKIRAGKSEQMDSISKGMEVRNNMACTKLLYIKHEAGNDGR